MVLPSLQLPEESLQFESGPPADMSAAWTRLPLPLRRPGLSWEAQTVQEQHRQTQLTAWAGGRVIQEVTQMGVPNSSGTEARIDWPSLRHLPPSGTVLATREDILIQAAVWYRLALGKKGTLLEALSERTATWKDYFPAARCPPAEAAGQLQAKLAEANADLPTRVMARVLLDLRYRSDDEPSALRFELDDKVRVTLTPS